MNPRQQTLAFADEAQPRVHGTVQPLVGRLLSGPDRDEAIETIKANHYTHSVPNGKAGVSLGRQGHEESGNRGDGVRGIEAPRQRAIRAAPDETGATGNLYANNAVRVK